MAASEIERLLRKELRTEKKVDRQQEILLIKSSSVEYGVAKALLEQIFQGRPAVRGVKSTQQQNVLLPTTLERELSIKLKEYLEDKEFPHKCSPIMNTIPEKLIISFAKRNKIKGTLPKHDDILELIERLQKQQPQTKAALQKSFSYLAKAAKK